MANHAGVESNEDLERVKEIQIKDAVVSFGIQNTVTRVVRSKERMTMLFSAASFKIIGGCYDN